jgi:Fe-S-cluster containining protein
VPWKTRRLRRRTYPVVNCDCGDCRAACLTSPGWFMPEEVPRLARRLGLTVAETFLGMLGLGVTTMPGGGLRRGVMPHKLRDHKRPGGLWSLQELAPPGRCIFYDRGQCAIYDDRPYECARMIHDRKHDAVGLRHQVVRAWNDAALAPYLGLAHRRDARPKGPKRH